MYIIENMAQAACFLLAKSAGGVDEHALYVLGKVAKVSFMHPVVPGDQLITTVNVVKKFGPTAMVEAKASVDGRTVASGELMFAATKG